VMRGREGGKWEVGLLRGRVRFLRCFWSEE
jgi:hypothetical protein